MVRVKEKDALAIDMVREAYELAHAKRHVLGHDTTWQLCKALLHAQWTIEQLQSASGDPDLSFENFIKVTGIWRDDYGNLDPRCQSVRDWGFKP